MYPVTNLSTRVNEIIASGLKIGNLLRYNRNHKNKKKAVQMIEDLIYLLTLRNCKGCDDCFSQTYEQTNELRHEWS